KQAQTKSAKKGSSAAGRAAVRAPDAQVVDEQAGAAAQVEAGGADQRPSKQRSKSKPSDKTPAASASAASEERWKKRGKKSSSPKRGAAEKPIRKQESAKAS